MAFRLGRKVAKIWRWMTRLRRSTSYGRLDRQSRRKPVGIRVGNKLCRRPVGYQTSFNFSQYWHFHLPQGVVSHSGIFSGDHVPKGFLAVYVGQGEEQERYVVPVVYFNHPLFGELLREAEEEYGFEQKGTINIPCKVAHFEKVQKLIHRESSRKHKH